MKSFALLLFQCRAVRTHHHAHQFSEKNQQIRCKATHAVCVNLLCYVSLASYPTTFPSVENMCTDSQRVKNVLNTKGILSLMYYLSISAFQDFHSGYPGRVPPNQSEQRLQPAVVTGTELTPEPLYFEVKERNKFSLQHCYITFYFRLRC